MDQENSSDLFNSDLFKEIVLRQLGYQTALGYGPTSFKTSEDRMNYIRDTCLALNVEVAEFLQELPWKPWRPLSGQKKDLEAAADEVADIMIFVFNLWISLSHFKSGECATELANRIIKKQSVNIGRLTSGYNTHN